MKSIRLSLIVYFLLLLVGAESVAFWLVYQSAEVVLREKQATNQKLLDEQFKRLNADEERQFDAELFEQAREVAYLASRDWQWERLRYVSMHMLGQALDTQAHMTIPILTLAGSLTTPGTSVVRDTVNTTALSSRGVPEEYLPKGPAGETEYFQLNYEWRSRPWTSRSLQGELMSFDKDSLELYQPHHDTYTLAESHRVRRVMVKVTANPRLMFRSRMGPPRPQGQNPPPPPRDGPGQPRSRPNFDRRQDRPPDQVPGPWVIVQVARDLNRFERTMVTHQLDQAADLQSAEQSANDSLAALRYRLLAIIGGTVVAMLLGGLVLGGYGLAPLQRLSDAVSRVTSADFQLPLENEQLPSELAPIRDRLQETLNDLRKAFEREKQSSADISHELRTPVASLLTTVEVALKKPRSAEEYRHTLDECRTIGRQMRQLVERLLTLARLDSGVDRLATKSVNVNELVAESAALVRPLATERGLELHVHCPSPVTVKTDPEKLREVLVNLLHNAVQYNKPRGSIDVAAERSNGWLDLRVHDTGIGIQPESFDRIFERFYRVDPSRHADDAHAGLGLSIVKGYVGLLGGTISVESKPGQGSTFRVRLPAA